MERKLESFREPGVVVLQVVGGHSIIRSARICIHGMGPYIHWISLGSASMNVSMDCRMGSEYIIYIYVYIQISVSLSVCFSPTFSVSVNLLTGYLGNSIFKIRGKVYVGAGVGKLALFNESCSC